MIVQADIDFEEKIDKKTIDSITLYLAQNAPDVVSLLKGLKPAIKKGYSPAPQPCHPHGCMKIS